MNPRIEQSAQLAAVAILAIGCYVVLRPFLSALLFAAVVCWSTWPVREALRRLVRGGRSLTASILVAALVLIVLVPFVALAATVADQAPGWVERGRAWIAAGPPPAPAWLVQLPYVGEAIGEYWETLTASREAVLQLVRSASDPLRRLTVATVAVLGEGILQLVLTTFVAYFFYRDGDTIVAAVASMAERVAGPEGPAALRTTGETVLGVIYGIVGTALAQALAALVGFWIASVPGALLLSAATFLLSLVPVGPPLVWGGAAIWLLSEERFGWAIFVALWGLLVISSIDNVLKPLLISRGARLPFLLVLLGVLGGVLAFGLIGVFLGPVLLAVGLGLVRRWVGQRDSTRHADRAPGADPPT
ncbi:MAG: AI-2E family transporter [Burkholderiales bacterium]|nr:AI-2E family transporter [Burkholderiales bacterium]